MSLAGVLVVVLLGLVLVEVAVVASGSKNLGGDPPDGDIVIDGVLECRVPVLLVFTCRLLAASSFSLS